MKFLLDTNFLLIPGQFGVDIFKELEKFGKLEVYTIDLVIEELERLAKKNGKDSKAAKLGLILIQGKNVAILQSEEKKTDRELERLSKDYVVCTQDKGIIKKLKQNKIKTISLRQKKYLELV